MLNAISSNFGELGSRAKEALEAKVSECAINASNVFHDATEIAKSKFLPDYEVEFHNEDLEELYGVLNDEDSSFLDKTGYVAEKLGETTKYGIISNPLISIGEAAHETLKDIVADNPLLSVGKGAIETVKGFFQGLFED